MHYGKSEKISTVQKRGCRFGFLPEALLVILATILYTKILIGGVIPCEWNRYSAKLI